MSKIYVREIDDLIDRMTEAGVNVFTEDYIIVAHPDVEFDSGVYPLEIVTSLADMPPNAVVFIMKRTSDMGVLNG